MKSWQVFFFTLIPFALVFMFVIIGSFPGVDSELDRSLIQAPKATSTTGPAPTAVPGATMLDLVANNLLFDKDTLAVAANSEVVLGYENQDAGVDHNFSLYSDDSVSEGIFIGPATTGPENRNYSFPAPAAGSYFFRCDFHPDTMTGTFTVTP